MMVMLVTTSMPLVHTTSSQSAAVQLSRARSHVLQGKETYYTDGSIVEISVLGSATWKVQPNTVLTNEVSILCRLIF